MKNNKAESVWLYASVTGSLWASVEIIIGSFLHNLHFPMSGTLLSLVSVGLISASIQSWNVRGVVWRAALICASMKSISPSAVILGPIVAIVMEGFLYEAVLRIGGRNLLTLILAGGIAASWSIIQKVMNLIIVYGTNLIDLYLNLYQYALKKTGNFFLFQEPYYLIIVFLLIPSIGGMVFSGIGIYLGRKSLTLKNNCISEEVENAEMKKKSTSISNNPHLGMLFFQLVAIIAGLTFIERAHVVYGAVYAGIFIAYNLFYYKGLYNKFKKPRIYIAFIIIAFLTGFFLGGVKEGFGFTLEGAFIGLKMILRAFVMIIGFSVIGIELKNEKIKKVFYWLGFERMQPAMEVAFLSLPFMMGSLQKIFQKTKNPFRMSECMMASARSWVDNYVKNEKTDPSSHIIIITGDKHSGKTTLALQLAEEFKKNSIPVRGFLTPGYMKNGSRSGFDIVSLVSGKKRAFAVKGIASDANRIGRFSIYRDSLHFGEESIILTKNINRDDISFCFIDEIGPLELEKKGWHKSLLYALSHYQNIVIVVRQSLLKEFIHRYNLRDFLVLEVKSPNTETGKKEPFLKVKEARFWIPLENGKIDEEILKNIINYGQKVKIDNLN